MPRQRSHRRSLTLQQWFASRTRGTVIWLAVVVGILLWARVIILSKIPRTAIAGTDPATAMVDEPAHNSALLPASDPWHHPAETRRHVVVVD
jgi:hypothetical protein